MVRRLIVSLLMLSVAVLGIATTSEAAGFRIAAHGAKAMGMSGAFAAQADDPAAIYYNPAGITQLDGTQIQTGFTTVHQPGTGFTPFPGQATLPSGTAQSADVPHRTFYLPTFFATHKVTDGLSVGFGTYTPFGLQLDWPDTWAGRQITTFNELKSHYFDFVAAYDVLPWWTVSAGFDVVQADVRLSRTTFNGAGLSESLLQFDADGIGFTYELGTLVRLAKWAKVGVSYRHQAVIDFDGDLEVSPVAGALAIPANNVQPSQAASTTLPLPRTLVIGIAAKPLDRWTVEFDWDFTFWQSFRDLSLRVPGSPFIEGQLALASPSPNRRWKNSHIFRLGTQYQVLDPLALRIGAQYITTPIPDETLDPILPDSDRTAITGGFGYTFLKNLTFDFAYEYQHFHDRAKNNNVLANALAPGLLANGVYKTDAHVFVAQLKYRF
jgi:long-chain fatty acid transport protein